MGQRQRERERESHPAQSPAGDGPDDDQQGSAPRAWDKGKTQGVLEPEGAPPPLTAQQRARLHAILQARDPDGRVPYGRLLKRAVKNSI